MKLRLYLLLIIASFGCKANGPDADLETSLKTAMQQYLYSTINNDSSNVKYHVEKVVYYDDKIKDKYICEFTVNLKAKLFDTTGIMKADISRDFKKVERIY